jgi:hypothetical protein
MHTYLEILGFRAKSIRRAFDFAILIKVGNSSTAVASWLARESSLEGGEYGANNMMTALKLDPDCPLSSTTSTFL